MSEAEKVDQSPSQPFTIGQQEALLDQYERADGMAGLAVGHLKMSTGRSFENSLAVVTPLLGYAVETVAKLTWALHWFHHNDEMPQARDLKEAATFPKGEIPFRGDRIPAGFRGHAAMPIVNDLVKRVDHSSAQALKEVIECPVHQGCLGLITTFHGFTRYALLDELLDPERDEEVRFGATVFAVQHIVMADYPDMNSVEAAAHHAREFLPRLAVALLEPVRRARSGLCRRALRHRRHQLDG